MVDNVRGIPAVHRFLSDPRIARFEALLGSEPVKRCIAQTLDGARRDAAKNAPDFDRLCASIAAQLLVQQRASLGPVINATGILLHTNLGRAPLAKAALEEIAAVGAGYSNLEYDLAQGRRASRYEHVTSLLRAITGAQDALIVNNCAAAVLLAVDTFARNREVVVSRDQLIEIGGGFRLPDVIERSGAQLVEVGTTNKVYLADFECALSPRTALLLRTHPSNFRVSGFVSEAEPKALAALGRRAGIPVMEDLGSGALIDLAEYHLPHERTVQEAIADGIDLVTFSGDKLLGGPQAGIILGSHAAVARLRANPLVRALRVDKVILAALAQTLRLYAEPQRRSEIPFFAMLEATIDSLRARAAQYVAAVPGANAVDSTAYVGAGSLPESGVASVAVSLAPPAGADACARGLREAAPPVIARVENGRVLLDLRTIAPHEDPVVIGALRSLI